MKNAQVVLVVASILVMVGLICAYLVRRTGYIEVSGFGTVWISSPEVAEFSLVDGSRSCLGYGRYHVKIPAVHKTVVVHKNAKGVCAITKKNNEIDIFTDENAWIVTVETMK